MPKPVSQTFEVGPGGGLRKEDMPRWEWLLSCLKQFSEGAAEIVIRRPKRTPEQNRYYWGGVLGAISTALAEAGQPASTRALHVHFKRTILGYTGEVEEIFGKTYLVEPTTTDLDTTAFHEFIEAIRFSEEVQALRLYIMSPEEWEEANGKIRSGRIAEPPGVPTHREVTPEELAELAHEEADRARIMAEIQENFDTEAA